MKDLSGIKNIIFDLGGVLLNLDFKRTQQAFVDLGIIDFESYYSKAKQNGLFDAFETGKITEIDFCNEIRKLSGIKSADNEIIKAWNAMLLNFPKVRKELLLRLKKLYQLSLLSNTNETHVRAFNIIIQNDINEKELAPLFHTHYFSNEIGLRKPTEDAFNYVLQKNNYIAEETLFIDDSIQHIKGAQKCGLRTIHIQGKTVEELFANFLT